MWKRILFIWFVANFVLVGIASLALRGWYLSQPLVIGMVVELALIMLPNLALPVLALHLHWIEPQPRVTIAKNLGWRWSDWRAPFWGLLSFGLIYLLENGITRVAGPSIPYNLPGSNGALQASTLVEALGLLLLFSLFVALTVAGEETMFRGFIQGQVYTRYGAWLGVALTALLFGLRHLPADVFYAHAWSATPAMWLSRQLQLYSTALLLGLARHFGRSTYAPAITHLLLLLQALFG